MICLKGLQAKVTFRYNLESRRAHLPTMFPSPDILNNYEHGKFVLTNLAAKRAKQLREGAAPLVNVDSNHPLTIALAEIAAGKIKAILPTAEELRAYETHGFERTDDILPAELGMLLPALDEAEVDLIAKVVEEDHDDHGADALDDVMKLSDIALEEEDAAPVVSEDDTLSLSDIAEQETALDDEDETDS